MPKTRGRQAPRRGPGDNSITRGPRPTELEGLEVAQQSVFSQALRVTLMHNRI